MNTQLFPGKTQDWCASFDLADARESTYDLLAQGRLCIGNEEYTFDTGHLAWKVDNTYHPSWRLRFLGLKWLCPLINEASNPAKRETRIPLVQRVIKDWFEWEKNAASDQKTDHWDGHTVALRTTTLIAASEYIREEWLRKSIVSHGYWLAADENWDGPWNHGLMQSIALLAVGLRLDVEEFRTIALDRVSHSVAIMVDDQGCINEQAPAYARFVYNLLKKLSEILKNNSIIRPDFDLSRILESLIGFMTHSTDPSGNFAQLGDSFRTAPMVIPETSLEYVVSAGSEGIRPNSNVVVYDQGFIFGRSGWGEKRPFQNESYYSIRFGPKRIIHGHNDHMGITFYDELDIIVDSGHNGYLNDEFRKHLRSIDAHNVLRVRGFRHDWSATTSLLRREISDESQFFELQDRAYPGFLRTRSISASPKGPLVVLDRVKSDSGINTFDQLWHLSRHHEITRAENGILSFSIDDGLNKTHLISYRVDPDLGILAPNVNFWKGNLDPHQGWTSEKDRENVPSPVGCFTVSASNLFLITCVVPLSTESVLGHSLRRESEGWLILRVHTEKGSWAWRISHGGFIALRARPE